MVVLTMAPGSTKSKDPAGWHDASGWRLMTATSVFLAAWSAVAIWLELRVFALICLVGAPVGAFIGGYCFRQQVIATGRLPRFRWLWLKEDLPRVPPD